VRLSAKGSHVWKGKRKGCQGLYVDAEREREEWGWFIVRWLEMGGGPVTTTRRGVRAVRDGRQRVRAARSFEMGH
jgi:hypothetical protein